MERAIKRQILILFLGIILLTSCGVPKKAQIYPQITKEIVILETEETEEIEIESTEEEITFSDSLSYDEFWQVYSSMEDVTWEQCLIESGMDEWQLRVALGWTVNEGYLYYDTYLCYLCANCPWAYVGDAYTMANGIAGWDYSGMYSVENLTWQSYNASQEELNIFYLAIKYPYYGIFGCDGVSWYGEEYLLWSDGYINVWIN